MADVSKRVERTIIYQLVKGKYRNVNNLPLEVELVKELNVSRTTLREVLKKLQSYGFIESKRGSPAKIKNFLNNGNLLTLAKIAEYVPDVPVNYLEYLLELRVGIMPFLVEKAVKNHPEDLVSVLVNYKHLRYVKDFVDFDWGFHKKTSELSENPIALMLVNSFENVFKKGAKIYFSFEMPRLKSLEFYKKLIGCTMSKNFEEARCVTEMVMKESLDLWLEIKNEEMERLGL